MRIVSGGQTGVDRAALDVALAAGIECGGWCPAGRWAEDGRIPDRYPLRETPSGDPRQRTEWNVRDTDATLILAPEPLRGGTALTRELAQRHGRHVLVADPFTASPDPVRDWIHANAREALNVAGPRESESPGIGRAAAEFLKLLFG